MSPLAKFEANVEAGVPTAVAIRPKPVSPFPAAQQPANPTAQQIFDHVLTHLRKQGGPSMDTCSSICMYRAPGGKMCAVGCLIPDEKYTPDMEGITVSCLLTAFSYGPITSSIKQLQVVLEESGLLQHGVLLMDLQTAHDVTLEQGDLREWELAMRRIAKDHGLTYTEPSA